MKKSVHIVVDDNRNVYCVGSYWECDEWRERYCKDESYLNDDCEDIECYTYNGKQVYIEKRG